ncbi:MAG: HAD hydrolase-like protein [Pseudomonadota bacterium]
MSTISEMGDSMPTGTVVFDLDGTLADTSGDLLAAANVALNQLGHDVRLERGLDDQVALRGGKAMLRRAFEKSGFPGAEAEIEVGYPLVLAAYAEALDAHTTLYPGAISAVLTLQRAGFATSICTNKPAALAEDLLSRLGVRQHFAALIGADTLTTRKPDPAPYIAAVERSGGMLAQSLLVGDTDTDRKTAAAAGVPCILVDFSQSDVASLRPDAMISHFDELKAQVLRLLRPSD